MLSTSYNTAYLCRQEPRAVYCRNVQLMPPLFTVLELGFSMFLTFMCGCVWQLLLNQHDDETRYGNRNTANSSISSFFLAHTGAIQIRLLLLLLWRRPSKKRLRISTNDLYCQKLDLLTYIFAADSMGFTFINFHVIMLQSRTLWI